MGLLDPPLSRKVNESGAYLSSPSDLDQDAMIGENGILVGLSFIMFCRFGQKGLDSAMDSVFLQYKSATESEHWVIVQDLLREGELRNCAVGTMEEIRGMCSGWSWEENKLFELALAIVDEGNPDRWNMVASMVGGKSAEEVEEHFWILVEDLQCIESEMKFKYYQEAHRKVSIRSLSCLGFLHAVQGLKAREVSKTRANRACCRRYSGFRRVESMNLVDDSINKQ
ncbi:hypothetical protein MRB53_010494 [Persea americana]|uniref:Uncharacterized protein n=1 Tax=Persea americana TaxID=3435 RepID=A0ACC2LSZ1_PERAE|nr:hypothetical protein MRB53_010494 [Persea americana]